MKVEKLFTYHLKSGKGKEQLKINFNTTGFHNDRSVAVINSENKIITGREYSELLGITSDIVDENFELVFNTAKKYSFPLPSDRSETLKIKLFRDTVIGHLFCDEANFMISQHLKGDYRLVYIGNNYRPLLEKRGGKKGEQTAYADSSPVHLINLKTLDYINNDLKDRVSVRHFRANIVIEGGAPFEEDTWSLMSINGFHFRIQERTQRCIFTTIDPDTHVRNEELQPLTRIAEIRSASGMRPTFGIDLVPMASGTIKVGDSIEIIKK